MNGEGWLGGTSTAPRGAVEVRHKQPLPAHPTGSPAADRTLLERRKIRHDIHHELATIMLLAATMRSAADIGPVSRARAEHLLGEARWLELLLTADEDTARTGASRWAPPAERVRLDTLAVEVLGAWRLTSRVRASVEADEAWTYANRLMLWRALRNVVDNAYRAAGPVGSVRVRVAVEDGWSVAQIDDDGPGFGPTPPGLASLGLSVVNDLVTQFDGMVRMGPGELGGGCVRILLPKVPAPPLPGADGAGTAV